MADIRKNPSKTAVSLGYDAHRDKSPRVTAKGRANVAERIIALAREHGVPIKEDPDLVQVLYQLDLESEIPPALYTVIAEIFAFVYSLNRRWSEHDGT